MIQKLKKARDDGMKKFFFIPLLAVVVVMLSVREAKVGQDVENANNDEIETVTELKRYIKKNIIYPREAVEEGLAGKVKLYACVNDKGRIEEVIETRPGPDYIEIDEIIVKEEGEKKKRKRKPELLITESRRVIMSLPCLNITEFKGQVLEFNFRFVLE